MKFHGPLRLLASNVWFLASLVITGLAVWLAEATLYVHKGSDDFTGIALALRNGSLSDEPWIRVFAERNDSVRFFLRVRGQPGTQLAIEVENGVDSPNESQSCEQSVAGVAKRTLELKRSGDSGSTYLLAPEPREYIDVSCTTKQKVSHETFVGRKVVFFANESAGCRGCQEIPSFILDFSQISRATHLEFVGGEPLDERERRLIVHAKDPRAFSFLQVAWEDPESAQQRDLRLVIIGLIVAAAAGAFIEWVRPRIDEFRAWGRMR